MLRHSATNGVVFPSFVFASMEGKEMEGVFTMVLLLEWRFYVPFTAETEVEELDVSVEVDATRIGAGVGGAGDARRAFRTLLVRTS